MTDVIGSLEEVYKEAKRREASYSMRESQANLDAFSDACKTCGYVYSFEGSTIRVCHHQLGAVRAALYKEAAMSNSPATIFEPLFNLVVETTSDLLKRNRDKT